MILISQGSSLSSSSCSNGASSKRFLLCFLSHLLNSATFNVDKGLPWYVGKSHACSWLLCEMVQVFIAFLMSLFLFSCRRSISMFFPGPTLQFAEEDHMHWWVSASDNKTSFWITLIIISIAYALNQGNDLKCGTNNLWSVASLYHYPPLQHPWNPSEWSNTLGGITNNSSQNPVIWSRNLIFIVTGQSKVR